MRLPSQYRWNRYKEIRQAIDDNEGGMDSFTKGELHFVREKKCFGEFCVLGYRPRAVSRPLALFTGAFSLSHSCG